MVHSGLRSLNIIEAHLATTTDAYFHCQMVGRHLPKVALLEREKKLFLEEGGRRVFILQTHLLLLGPLLFSPLSAILQLACECQDVVLPNLKALRVHEPEQCVET